MSRRLPRRLPNHKYRFRAIHESAAMTIKSLGVEVFAAHLSDDDQPKSPASVRNEMTQTKSPGALSSPKLGLDDAVAAAYLSGDVTWLSQAADLMDHILVPREAPDGPAGRLDKSLSVLGIIGKFQGWLSEALRDGEITDAEWEIGQIIFKDLERQAAAAGRTAD